jgi:hypothetical protein
MSTEITHQEAPPSNVVAIDEKKIRDEVTAQATADAGPHRGHRRPCLACPERASALSPTRP